MIANKSLSISLTANMCSCGISHNLLYLFFFGIKIYNGNGTGPTFSHLEPWIPSISSENGAHLEFSASIFAAGPPSQWCTVARRGVPWLRYPVGIGTRWGSCLKPEMQTPNWPKLKLIVPWLSEFWGPRNWWKLLGEKWWYFDVFWNMRSKNWKWGHLWRWFDLALPTFGGAGDQRPRITSPRQFWG